MDSALNAARFEAVIEGLGNSFGLPGLRPDANGTCLLSFDDSAVTLQRDAKAESFTVFTQVGTLAADPSIGRLEGLLAANLFWTQTAGATLSLVPGNRGLILARRFELESHESARFEAALGEFITAAELWRERLLEPDEAPAADTAPHMFGIRA